MLHPFSLIKIRFAMKILVFYLTSMLIFFACSDQKKESRISVSTNFSIDSLEIIENKYDFVFYQGKVLKKFGKQDIQTSFDLPLNKQKKLTLSFPEIYKIDFFVEPGDSIGIRIEKLENGSFKVHFTGSNSTINQFYFDDILMCNLDMELSNEVYSLNYYDFDDFCNSNFQKHIEILKLDEKDDAKKSYILSYLESLYISYKIYKIISYPPDSLKSFQDTVYSLIEQINRKGNKISRFKATLLIVENIFKYFEMSNEKSNIDNLSNRIKIIRKYFKNEIVDIAFYKLIHEEIYSFYNDINKEKTEYILNEYSKDYYSEEIHDFVINEYKRIYSLQSAESVFPLVITDTSNNKRFLNDVTRKGSFYIFLWGSWCSYCYNHIFSYNHLFDELSSKGIKFINIACEYSNDYISWKSMMKIKGMKGESFFLHYSPLSDAFEKYNITGIPRFMIVKDGKFIDTYASPPDNPELKTILLNTLNKNDKNNSKFN